MVARQRRAHARYREFVEGGEARIQAHGAFKNRKSKMLSDIGQSVALPNSKKLGLLMYLIANRSNYSIHDGSSR
jgi:hypothetical protein